jgi:RNA polymerase sigma-70 factor, ECF subfamily
MIDPMEAPDRDDRVPAPTELERRIREHVEHGRTREAATAAIQGYGPELLGYLGAIARDDDQAQDVFSALCERLWRKLPEFRWQSSLRTWAYAIARNLACDAQRVGARRRGRELAIDEVPEVAALAEQVRSTTMLHLRSASQRKLDELRATLEADDRTMLVLSLDRKMSWREIAVVMADGPADEAELQRISARLRKRFERLKERLRAHLQGSDTR